MGGGVRALIACPPGGAWVGVKGRAFIVRRFTCRFVEKLPVSGARVTILRWVVTNTIASFKMKCLMGGESRRFSPALYICSVSPHSSLRSHFSSSALNFLPCYSALYPHSSSIRRKSGRRRNAAVAAGPIARCCPFVVSVRFRPSLFGEYLFSISSVFVLFCLFLGFFRIWGLFLGFFGSVSGFLWVCFWVSLAASVGGIGTVWWRHALRFLIARRVFL